MEFNDNGHFGQFKYLTALICFFPKMKNYWQQFNMPTN